MNFIKSMLGFAGLMAFGLAMVYAKVYFFPGPEYDFVYYKGKCYNAIENTLGEKLEHWLITDENYDEELGGGRLIHRSIWFNAETVFGSGEGRCIFSFSNADMKQAFMVKVELDGEYVAHGEMSY